MDFNIGTQLRLGVGDSQNAHKEKGEWLRLRDCYKI